MKMKKYLPPTIKFEELELFERIAEVCWGYNRATWVGTNRDGETVTVSATWTNGCKGGIPAEFIAALEAANVDSTQFSNSIANTKDSSIDFPDSVIA
ncbi:MAG: hypothetical protein VB118_12365 [Oscillospiraceae bacterium]|nr:hypothetical protein [Oscillospiraceae bacterium]